MGIDNVALKTFNSTGSQSVCRANEADSTQLIESQFLTKCTTEYINGSGVSYIQGKTIINLDAGDTTTDTFYLPSDCDAISEIIWSVTGGVAGAAPTNFSFDNITLIEIKVGNLTVQKISKGDIINRNLTESNGGTLIQSGEHAFSIPFVGRAKNVKNCFLQAGAVTNPLKLIIKYTQPAGGSGSGKTGITVLSHQMTKTEKDFISKNIINRVVHTSQNIHHQIVSVPSGQNFSVGNDLVIDLSSININVSHILINSALTRPPQAGTIVADIQSVQLILGNDRTGDIPVESLDAKYNAELFSLNSTEGYTSTLYAPSHAASAIYILKTADSAFSTAGIPFSRLNNKHLIIKFKNGSNFDPATDTPGPPHLSITACGTQIQTTVGGSTSFSA